MMPREAIPLLSDVIPTRSAVGQPALPAIVIALVRYGSDFDAARDLHGRRVRVIEEGGAMRNRPPARSRSKVQLPRDLFRGELDGRVVGEISPLRTTDVVRPQIDVCAQYALLRMAKDPTAAADCAGMVEAVRTGDLSGIHEQNVLVSVRLAEKLGRRWWELLPDGEDAVLVVDPVAPATVPPTIVFRSTQTTRTRDGEHLRCLDRTRLDSALRRAWIAFRRLRAGELVPCVSAATSPSVFTEAAASGGPMPVTNVVPMVLCPAPPRRPSVRIRFPRSTERRRAPAGGIVPASWVASVGRPPDLLVGFNYPWAWNKFGLYFGGDPPGSSAMDDWLRYLRVNLHYLKTALNVLHIRIFLLCNAANYGSVSGGWFPRFSLPSRLSPKFTDHLRRMLDTFASERMLAIPSLLSYEAFWAKGRPGGGQGRADVANDPAVRERFYEQVLEAFLAASIPYKPSIFAWEVINEPMWDTSPLHASFRAGRPVLAPDVSETAMRTFLNGALVRIHAAGFGSTVGHRYFDDIARYPTGTRRQFHYYPRGLGKLVLPSTDPNPLPTFAEAQAFVGEFSCQLPGEQTGAWPELNLADTIDVPTAVHERLRLLNAKGYPLALVWPDGPESPFPGPDRLKLSMDAQLGIKRYLAAPRRAATP
jgi:hypothetical protein